VPLRSARHHFGAAVSRGSRPYNEDAHNAGVINLPAFAKKPPVSLQLDKKRPEATSAQGESGDPQVFYFGVFDGHGGSECSDFLREQLHKYIEESAHNFDLHSTLRNGKPGGMQAGREYDQDTVDKGKEALKAIDTDSEQTSEPSKESPQSQGGDTEAIASLEKTLVKSWSTLVGGYYRRFKPKHFSVYEKSTHQSGTSIEEVLMYSFLKADYDFVSAQAAKRDQEKDVVRAERPLNDGDILGVPHVGGDKQFKGGSTASLALVSTPTPVPFWHPASTSTLLIAHVGDTRVLLSSTSTGNAVPLTTNHHPSSPIEASRLRRYAATFVTDSFGEERTISGLA
jgi:protein phosphatase PTC6